VVNKNKLVHFYPGVDGLKTGYTNEAKYCLTATAKKDDMRVIAVVMGAETPKDRNNMISNLLDYAYSQFETKQLFEKDEKIKTLNFKKAENMQTNIVASESISTIYKKGEFPEDIVHETEINDNLELPIKRGDKIGTLYVKEGTKVLTETDLTVDHDVEKAGYYTLLKRAIQDISKAK